MSGWLTRVSLCPRGVSGRFAVELRHVSWFHVDVYAVLRRWDLCLAAIHTAMPRYDTHPSTQLGMRPFHGPRTLERPQPYPSLQAQANGLWTPPRCPSASRARSNIRSTVFYGSDGSGPKSWGGLTSGFYPPLDEYVAHCRCTWASGYLRLHGTLEPARGYAPHHSTALDDKRN